MEKDRKELFNRIILKGGLFGNMASLYCDDEEKGNDFLGECFEQFHNKSIWDYWGKELVLDVINYRLKFLRFRFEQLYAANARYKF